MELKEVWQRFALFDPSLASDHIKDPHQLPFIEKHISGEYCLLMEQGMQLALHIQYYSHRNKSESRHIFPLLFS